MALIKVNSWSFLSQNGGLRPAPIDIIINTDGIIGIEVRKVPYNTTGATNILYNHSVNDVRDTIELIVTDTILSLEHSDFTKVNSFTSLNGTLNSTSVELLIGSSFVDKAEVRTPVYLSTGITNLYCNVPVNSSMMQYIFVVEEAASSLVTPGGGDIVTPEDLTSALALKVAKAGDIMTGLLNIKDDSNPKISLHNNTVGNSASITLGPTSQYVWVGGTDKGINTYRSIGMGYTTGNATPASYSYQEKDSSGNTYGDLLLCTRPDNTAAFPVPVLRITHDMKIIAETGAVFQGDGSGLTGVVGTVANTLTTGRTFSLTGGATGTSAAFNGSANNSIPVTLATPTGVVRGGILQQPNIPDVTVGPLDESDFNGLLAALRLAGVLASV